MRSVFNSFRSYQGRHRRPQRALPVVREVAQAAKNTLPMAALATIAMLGILGTPKPEVEIGPLPPDVHSMDEARDMAATHMYDKAELVKAGIVKPESGSAFRSAKTGKQVLNITIGLNLHPNEDTAYAIGEKEDDPAFVAHAGRVVLRPLQETGDGTYVAGKALDSVTPENDAYFHPQRSHAYIPVDQADKTWGVYVETNACVDMVCRSVETFTGALTIQGARTSIIPPKDFANTSIMNPNADLLVTNGSAHPYGTQAIGNQ